MSTENRVEERLSAVEDRLDRLENLLIGISQKLDKNPNRHRLTKKERKRSNIG